MNITLLNHISNAAAYTLMANAAFPHRRVWRYALCFVIVCALPMFFHAAYYVDLLNILLFCLCFGERKKGIQTLHRASAAILSLIACKGALSCLFVLLFPAWHRSTIFHLVMGTLLITFAALYRFWRLDRTPESKSRIEMLYMLLLESGFTLFYLFVIPVFARGEAKGFAIISLCFIGLSLLAAATLHLIGRQIAGRIECRNAQKQKRYIHQHLGQAMRVIQNAQSYVRPYERKLFHIQNVLLRNQLHLNICDLDALFPGKIELNIEGYIHPVGRNETVLHDSLCECFATLRRGVEGQSQPRIRISIAQKGESLQAVIAFTADLQGQSPKAYYCTHILSDQRAAAAVGDLPKCVYAATLEEENGRFWHKQFIVLHNTIYYRQPI